MAGSSSLTIDLDRLERKAFPNFKKPKELAILSTKMDDNVGNTADKNAEDWWCKHCTTELCKRALHDDPTFNRMVFSEFNLNLDFRLDLNVGFGTQIKKENDGEFMNILLESLSKYDLVGHSEFVSWRGLLTKICASPYEANNRFDEGMIIVVQKLKNVYYMYEFPTKQAKTREAEQTERQRLMQYWGMKFESYVTAKPGELPTPDKPMDFNHEFASIVATKLDSHTLLFGGEVDCCYPNDSKHYVELKTTREFQHSKQEYSFRRYKLIKWWLQSFLIGISDILCGFRDDDGIVRKCKWYKVAEIPQILKQDRDFCKPSVCFAFLGLFLDYVKSNVKLELQPHVFVRQPGSHQFNMNIDKCGQYNFLPFWFVDRVISKS